MRDLCAHIDERGFLDDVHRLVDESYSQDGFRECAALIGYREGRVRLSGFVCGLEEGIDDSVFSELFSLSKYGPLDEDHFFGSIHTHPVNIAGESFCFSPSDIANEARWGLRTGRDWWTCLAHSAGLGDLAVSCGHLSDGAFSDVGLADVDERARVWYISLAAGVAHSKLREMGRKAFVDFTDRRCASFEWR